MLFILMALLQLIYCRYTDTPLLPVSLIMSTHSVPEVTAVYMWQKVGGWA